MIDKELYVENTGRCPNCKSRDWEETNLDYVNSMDILVSLKCRECRLELDEVYELSRVINIYWEE